jgi:hypothetical protein
MKTKSLSVSRPSELLSDGLLTDKDLVFMDLQRFLTAAALLVLFALLPADV